MVTFFCAKLKQVSIFAISLVVRQILLQIVQIMMNLHTSVSYLTYMGTFAVRATVSPRCRGAQNTIFPTISLLMPPSAKITITKVIKEEIICYKKYSMLLLLNLIVQQRQMIHCDMNVVSSQNRYLFAFELLLISI